MIHRVFVGPKGNLWVGYNDEECAFALEFRHEPSKSYRTASFRATDLILHFRVRVAVNGGALTDNPGRPESCPDVADWLAEHFPGLVAPDILETLRCCRNSE